MRILVPTDFSEFSQLAFEHAARVADWFGGTVIPFHAYLPVSEMDSFYYTGVGVAGHVDYEAVEASIRERLDEIAARHVDAAHRSPGRIGIGNAAFAIQEAAADADLVCLTSHGRTGLTRLLLGSVTEKIIRVSPVPVLVAGRGVDLLPLDRILVTTDLSDASIAAIPIAAKWARAVGATLDVVHVLETGALESGRGYDGMESDRRASVEALIATHVPAGVMAGAMVIRTAHTPHEALTRLIKEKAYPLVVMATVGKTGLDYLMLGSTAAQVVRHAETTVLAVHPKI